jgi:circadian clock protein KaiC
VRVPPVDLMPDEISTQLLDLFRHHAVRRLVIDDLAFLLRSLGARAYDYLAALAEHFYGEGVTVLSTLEITPFAGLRVDLSNAPIEMLAENLIVLQEHEQAPDIQRTLAVLRMRFSDYEHQLRTLKLDAQGIQVLNTSPPPDA